MVRHSRWLDSIRTSFAHCDPQRESILTAPDTTTFPWIVHVAHRLGLATIVLQRGPDQCSETWFAECGSPLSDRLWSVYWWPLDAGEHTGTEIVDPCALQDWPTMMLAQEVRLLSVRYRGNIHRLAKLRLASADEAPLTYLLSEQPNQSNANQQTSPDVMMDQRVRDELRTEGAIDWILQPCPIPLEKESLPSRAAVGPVSGRSWTWSEIDLSEYLTHTTRAAVRPRPDTGAVERDFYQRMLLETIAGGDGALANLIRILVSARIRASRFLIRGGRPAVSFTAQPIQALPQLHTFRSHLGRWDFSPYGIAIRRKVLEQLGCRPVIYGDEAAWDSLADCDRPFFQRSTSRRGNRQIDWMRECEWRVLGDVELRRLSPTDAFVLVRCRDEIETAAPYSRWPILAVSDLLQVSDC